MTYYQSHSAEDIHDLNAAEFNRSIMTAYKDNNKACNPYAQVKSPEKPNPKDNKGNKDKPNSSNKSGGDKFYKYCEK